MRTRLIVLLVVWGLRGLVAASPLSYVPTVMITPPATDFPPEVAAFSGIWEGTWGGTLPGWLAVEELEQASAIVVYAWGDDPQGHFMGGWMRHRAQVLPGGTLRWSNTPGTMTFTFTLTQDHKSLSGQRSVAGAMAHIMMKQVPFAASLPARSFLAPLMPSPDPAERPRRVALVIGNAAYQDRPLRNPGHDATAMATQLRQLGFTVLLVQDADRPTLEQAVRDFTRTVPPGSLGLFYFSGHGVQIEGLNYLLPVGRSFTAPSDVKYYAVAADWVLARMEAAGMDVKLLILDACRNNPFGRSWERGLDRGLAHMAAVTGSLIAYATSPGRTAEDGPGRHAPYTKHLLEQLATPGLPVELLFKAVRVAVQRETNGRQTPWESSSLTGDVYFAGPPGVPGEIVTPPPASQPAPTVRPPMEAPLPDDVRITPPAAEVPPALAAFTGRWVGRWDTVLPHILIVEEIHPPQARVIYAWGTAPAFDSTWQPDWRRELGTFRDGVLTLALRSHPAMVRYRLHPDGTLNATYEWAGGITRAQLTRVPD